jgi:hypothetical protein
MTLLTSAALVAAVAVLAFSIVAKLSDWTATDSMWPITGRPRRIAGPAQVLALELVIVGWAIAPVPAGVRMLAVGLLYVGYTATAIALRGRRCTCFGGAFHTTFTARHAGLCGLLALVTLAGAANDPPARGALSAAATGAAAAGTAAAIAVWRRHARRRARSALPGQPEAAASVVILGDSDCPICAALWEQRLELTAIAACGVAFRHATDDADRRLADHRFPAAAAYDEHGTVVAGPVWGPVDIRRLLEATSGGDARDVDATMAG